MAKSEKTKHIEQSLWEEKNIRGDFGCFEVTVGWYGKEVVDFITYKTNGEFRCYEIKVSTSDFYSKAKVSFVGDFNYYVIPKELHEELRIHAFNGYKERKNNQNFINIFDERLKKKGIGLMTVDDLGNLETVVNSKRKYPDLSVKTTLLQSMVRSLNREVTKAYKNKGYWE